MKLLVVDDHALVREGLKQVLKGLDTWGEPLEILEAGTCAAALELVTSDPDLDLVLLDFHLPDANGLASLRRFAAVAPELPIIVLSGSVNTVLMQQVLDKGAAAFLAKTGLSDDLLRVTRQVLSGQPAEPMRPSTPPVNDDMGPEGDSGVAQPVFTRRQEEVLFLLMDGCSNKDIGRMLSLSEETVKNHISGILRGFGVNSRTQAVLAANRIGYVRNVSQF